MAAGTSLSTFTGVVLPTCENLWGVLIFLRFFTIVGNAGIGLAWLIVLISYVTALLTTLSLAAVVTNGPIEGLDAKSKGTYFLISRALGHKIGGAVGVVYFLGSVFLAVLEVLGAILIFEAITGIGDGALIIRGLALILIFILVLSIYVGSWFVGQLSFVFAAIVVLSLLSYYFGLFLAPLGGAPPEITGLSTTTFRDNFGPGFDDGVTFSTTVALFFPSFAAILSGAERAASLKHPERSIPIGTLIAITLSAAIYFSYMGLWGAVATRDYLLDADTSYGDSMSPPPLPMGGMRRLLAGGNVDVIKDIAWPSAGFAEIGIIIASLSQALQSLIVASTHLQSIAADGAVPFLHIFGKRSLRGEPKRAIIGTGILCGVLAMIGGLEIVAALLSICFLMGFVALNISSFLLTILKQPSWRPSWKYFHWSTALAGTVLSVALMFIISWYLALGALFLFAGLAIYIDIKAEQVDWGSGLGGFRLQLAVQAILSLGHELRYSINWRPQLLCIQFLSSYLVHIDDQHYDTSHSIEDRNKAQYLIEKEREDANAELLNFAAQLKKGRGLTVVVGLVQRTLGKDSGEDTISPQELSDVQERLQDHLESYRVRGFARAIASSAKPRDVLPLIAQLSGLGSLMPNTALLTWPSGRSDMTLPKRRAFTTELLLPIMADLTAAGKALIVLKSNEPLPKTLEERPKEGTIDVWWIVHDGSLLVLLAHLLNLHKMWESCCLRVNTVVEQVEDVENVKLRIQTYLNAMRIRAEVYVIEIDNDELTPYTYDWTLRVEEAKAYKEGLEQALSSQRTHTSTRRGPSLSSTSYTILNGSGHLDDSQGKGSMPNRDSTSNRSFPQEIDMIAGVRHIPREEREKGMMRRLSQSSLAENVSESKPTLDQIYSSIVQNKSDSTNGENHPSYSRSTSSEERSVAKPQILKPVPEIAPNSPSYFAPDVDDISDNDSPKQEGHAAYLQPSTIARENSAASNSFNGHIELSSRGGPRKYTEKENGNPDHLELANEADEYDTVDPMGRNISDPYEFAESPSNANVVVDILENGEEKSQQADSESNAETSTTSEVEERKIDRLPSVRTWSSFTQQCPHSLNRCIADKSAAGSISSTMQSSEAELVIINLPDPHSSMIPARYVNFTESMIKGLRRVVLVHGTGKEVYTIDNAS